MHGWLENSNSWDPFMNMVPEDEPISFLTIDMPGNGLSSHCYQNSWYHASEDMMALRLLLKHFQWKEPVTFLCHSYSTGHAYLYTAAFPKVRIRRMHYYCYYLSLAFCIIQYLLRESVLTRLMH
jgi:pimeloyl-ACP methyl ester carboxylesterase